MKKILTVTLCLSLIFAMQSAVFAGPAEWAYESVFSAQYEELVEGDLLSLDQFNDRINRAEFAEVIVKLYAKAEGIGTDTLTRINPFTDTDNDYVAMAYNLGIVGGKSEGIYAPNDNVKREEMAVMMVRMLDELDYDTSYKGISPYTDRSSVDSWALDAVDFCYQMGIMSGVGNNYFDPINNASRQQAIALSDKLAKRYEWIDAYDSAFYEDGSNFRTILDYSVPNRDLTQLLIYNKDGSLQIQSKGLMDMGVELDMKEQHRQIYNALLQNYDYAVADAVVNQLKDLWDPIKKTYDDKTLYINSSGMALSYQPSGSYVEIDSDVTAVLSLVK